MRNVVCFGLVGLAVALLSGCGDSNSQPWESNKGHSSADKAAAKSDDVADNDSPKDAGSEQTSPHGAANPHEEEQRANTEAGTFNPHIAADPHGMANPHAGGGEVATIENDGKLDADAAHWTVSKTWVRKQPKPSIVRTVAEYALPKADGDKTDVRFTVTTANSTVDVNIARWEHQFGEKPEQEKKETFDVSGTKVTQVDLSGTFDDGFGLGPRKDYRMIGAILQLPNIESLTFIKCYGPAKTMAAHADEVKAFIKSMKVDK